MNFAGAVVPGLRLCCCKITFGMDEAQIGTVIPSRIPRLIGDAHITIQAGIKANSVGFAGTIVNSHANLHRFVDFLVGLAGAGFRG